jgi:hypothetical protein
MKHRAPQSGAWLPGIGWISAAARREGLMRRPRQPAALGSFAAGECPFVDVVRTGGVHRAHGAPGA